MLTIESNPNKALDVINNVSIIVGACISKIVQYIAINKHTIHPKKPAILFDETGLSDDRACFINVINFIP